MTVKPALDRSGIVELIQSTLQEVLTRKGRRSEKGLSESTPLIGSQAPLDSLALVTFIVELEQRLDDEHNCQVTLADERAISQQHSPFRTIGSLADYASGLVASLRGNGSA